MPTANRRLLWAIITPVEKSDKALCDDGFMATDLGPEAIEEMCSKYQHFGCPIGGTMKDMFDQSPPHLMSKNLTHNRVHDKWCGGRTVLVGNGRFDPFFFPLGAYPGLHMHRTPPHTRQKNMWWQANE
jgi:hypothetical protein